VFSGTELLKEFDNNALFSGFSFQLSFHEMEIESVFENLFLVNKKQFSENRLFSFSDQKQVGKLANRKLAHVGTDCFRESVFSEQKTAGFSRICFLKWTTIFCFLAAAAGPNSYFLSTDYNTKILQAPVTRQRVAENEPIIRNYIGKVTTETEKWSTPNHKESCVKNKLNREKVQYQQCTGSQSYIAKAFILKQEKYKDAKPSAIDLFKEMQCSKKKGFSENVQKAIVDMEEMVAAPVQDGQQPKSPTEVVSNVLPGSSVFLRNVGLKSASQKSSTTT
ncbi:hypothetical protein ACJX0J_033709, partial [Zea mays]